MSGAGATGLAMLLSAFRPGMNAAEVNAAIARAGVETREAGVAEGLVRSGLLAALNTLRITPVDPDTGEIDTRAFARIVTLAAAGGRAFLVFGADRLELVYLRVPVPVDETKSRGSPARLERRRAALDEVRRAGFSLTASKTDVHGNTFTWIGERSGVSVVVAYVPAEDEVRVLLQRRNPR